MMNKKILLIGLVMLLLTVSFVSAENWYIKGGNSGLQNYSNTMNQGFYYQFVDTGVNLTLGSNQCSPSDVDWSRDGACSQPTIANREDFGVFNDNGYLWWHPSSAFGGVQIVFNAPRSDEEYFYNASFYKYTGGNNVNFSIKREDGTVLYAGIYAGGALGSTSGSVNLTAGEKLFFIAETPDSDAGDSSGILLNISSKAGIVEPNNFSITAKDIYDNTSITNFSISVDGEEYTTTTGTITTHLLENETSTYNILFYDAQNNKGNYYNKTYTDVDVSSNLIGYLEQSYASFQAYDLLGDTVEGTFYINGLLRNDYYPIKAGTYNVTFVNSTYYNKTSEITINALTNNTYNITDVYNSQLYITAKDNILNTSINIFNGWSYDNDNDINTTFSTTNGYAIVPTILNSEHTIYLIGEGYTSYTSNKIADLINTTYSVGLYGFNSVVINAYYLDNSTLINDKTLTIYTISNISSQTNTTSTGNLTLNFLNPLSYEVRISGLDLITNSKFITVVNDSTQQISFYMTVNDTPELQTFQILDTSNSEVQGAVLWVQKENLNGGDLWITVAEIETNNEGYAYAYINKGSGYYYRFAIKYDDEFKPIEPTGDTYTSKTSYITGVNTINQIVINLQESTTDFITNRLNIDCNISYSGVNDTVVNYDFADSNNAIVGGRIVVKGRYLATSTSYEDLYSYQLNSSTGSLNYTFPVLNNTIYQVQGIIVFSDHTEICTTSTKRFDADTIIDKNTGILYAIFIIAVVALLTARFGSLLSSVFSIASIIPLTIFGIVDLPISIISSFIVLAIILFGRQKGDNSDSGGGGL